MMRTCRIKAVTTLMCCGALLAACGQQEPPAESAASGQSAPANPPGITMAELNNSNTIRDVMNTLIDPNADMIWEAVRFENTLEEGPREYRPQTDEDWEALRRSAVAIIEGGNSLMIPGRRVAAPGATTPYPDYEFEPQEVQERLDEDFTSWVGFARGLQNAAIEVREAVESRDVEQYMAAGDQLDQACEACHAQYWYRPDSQN